MKRICVPVFLTLVFIAPLHAQLKWKNVDTLYGPLSPSVHVYFTNEAMDTGLFRAYYLIADLKDPHLKFTADTSKGRRLTPKQFYEKNAGPLAVVNCTFFSFETNQNLNLVMKDGKILSLNRQSLPGKGKDTFTYRHPVASALGISKKRKADVAWVITDSSGKTGYAIQCPVASWKDSIAEHSLAENMKSVRERLKDSCGKNMRPVKWKMETAVGGGPVLVQEGKVAISNNEEVKFSGKAINDKHPRTAMGYTRDGKLVILVVEGRNTEAHGATLVQEAQILADLGCVEALNLDGGGSSCLLVNGKETIRPADKVERSVPAVFIITSN